MASHSGTNISHVFLAAGLAFCVLAFMNNELINRVSVQTKGSKVHVLR